MRGVSYQLNLFMHYHYMSLNNWITCTIDLKSAVLSRIEAGVATLPTLTLYLSPTNSSWTVLVASTQVMNTSQVGVGGGLSGGSFNFSSVGGKLLSLLSVCCFGLKNKLKEKILQIQQCYSMFPHLNFLHRDRPGSYNSTCSIRSTTICKYKKKCLSKHHNIGPVFDLELTWERVYMVTPAAPELAMASLA